MIFDSLDHIYVIHYDPFKKRREYLEEKLKHLGILDKVVWVTEKDANKSNAEYVKDIISLDKRMKSQNLKKIRTLNKGDEEVVKQHLIALEKIVENKDNIALVLEDDAILNINFKKTFEKIINNLKETKWDICYTSFYRGIVSFFRFGSIFKAPNFEAKTTGSYLINWKGARKLKNLCKEFSLPVDWEFNYQQKRKRLDVFWSRKYLTYQGSDYGIYSGPAYIERKGKTSMGNFVRKIESRRLENTYYGLISLFFIDPLFYILNKIRRSEV